MIFTNQSNLVVDSGIHPSLHPNCHHQIIHCNINLQVEYPPPYQRHVWNYAKANKDAILSALQNVDCHRLFAKKTVHQQVNLLNDIILNIFTNFVPNKVIACDDRDPPWINDNIKNKIKWKNSMYKNYKRSCKKTEDYKLLVKAVSEVSQLIEKGKDEYYYRLGKRLNDPSTSAKSYSTNLKTFYNKRKIPLIPSLLVNYSFVTDFREKANLFNEFFCKQCTPVANDSTLPTLLETPNETLSSIEIIASDIGKIIKALKVNKAHGHDEVSVRILKLCESAITEPLYLIFKNCLSSNTFPDVWRKANVIPVHKECDKQVLKNYRSVSLLPICGKIFENLLFNALYSFFEDHKLLNPCQSGFKKNDSCINQLVSITHEIYSAFDCNPSLEVRGVFLDLSKAFDKVWHDGLIYKLKSLGISGSLLKLIQSYLDNRFQRVLLNGQTSEWKPVKSGVSQGSILGPLFILVYINDICSNLSTNVKLFADDTSLFSIVNNANKSFQNLSNDLCVISNWAYQWKMSFNLDRSKQAQEVIFSRKTSIQSHPVLTFDNSPVTKTTHHKHLGLILDEKLNFKEHLKEKMCKTYKGIAALRKLQNIITKSLY